MTRLEQIHKQETKQRYGIDKLQVDNVSNPRELLDSQLSQEPGTGEGIHFQRRMSELKAKFGVDSLKCDGLLGVRLAENQKTLEQAMIDDARQKRGNFNLSLAKVIYQNRPIRLYYEISI